MLFRHFMTCGGNDDFDEDAIIDHAISLPQLTFEAIGSMLDSPGTVKTTAVLYGQFLSPTMDIGPSGPYVYVPKGWCKPDNEYISTIFEALGLDMPLLGLASYECGPKLYPELGLRFVNSSKSLSVVPNKPNESQREMFDSFMPSRLNSNMATTSETLNQVGGMYICYDANRDNALANTIVNSLPQTGIALSVSYLTDGKTVPYSMQMSYLIRNNAVPLTDPVLNPVVWSSNSPYTPGMTHFLIFEDAEDAEYFQTVVGKIIPVGMVCAGGPAKLMDNAILTLRRGLPLVVLKYTVGTGHCMSSLLDHYFELNEATPKKKRKSEGDEKHAEPDEWSDAEMVQDVGNRLRPKGANPYGLTEQHDLKSHELVYNWPEIFNREALLFIDPTDLKRKELDFILSLTDMINSTGFADAELGGEEAEFAAVDFAARLYLHLCALHRNATKTAAYLTVVIIGLSTLITLIAVIIKYIESIPLNTSNPAIATGLNGLNTALPIILGIFLTINGGINPLMQVQTLKYAKESILSEWYKFRVRVGQYEPKFGTTPGQHRISFKATVDSIVKNLDGFDLAADLPLLIGEESDEDKKKKKKGGKKDEKDGKKGKEKDLKKAPPGGKPGEKSPEPKKLISVYSRQDEVTMQLKEYINERILGSIDDLGSMGPLYSKGDLGFQVVMTIMSGGCALFTIFNLGTWVPAILALVAAQDMYLRYRQLPTKNKQTNATFARLNQIMFWWEGVSLINQRLPKFKESLVTQVEEALMGLTSSITAMRK